MGFCSSVSDNTPYSCDDYSRVVIVINRYDPLIASKSTPWSKILLITPVWYAIYGHIKSIVRDKRQIYEICKKSCTENMDFFFPLYKKYSNGNISAITTSTGLMVMATVSAMIKYRLFL